MSQASNDLGLIWSGLASDCAIEDGDLAGENGLETAIILSLFCDARAHDDDILPSGTDFRRGWWADSIAPLAMGGLNLRPDSAANDRIGSRLWLLAREKELPEVLARAKDYAEEALKWLIDDGEAKAVSVRAYMPGDERAARGVREDAESIGAEQAASLLSMPVRLEDSPTGTATPPSVATALAAQRFRKGWLGLDISITLADGSEYRRAFTYPL